MSFNKFIITIFLFLLSSLQAEVVIGIANTQPFPIAVLDNGQFVEVFDSLSSWKNGDEVQFTIKPVIAP